RPPGPRVADLGVGPVRGLPGAAAWALRRGDPVRRGDAHGHRAAGTGAQQHPAGPRPRARLHAHGRRHGDDRLRRRHADRRPRPPPVTAGSPLLRLVPPRRLAPLSRPSASPTPSVVLMGVVLGHGADADPAATTAPAIHESLATAREAGRELAVIVSCVGTAG